VPPAALTPERLEALARAIHDDYVRRRSAGSAGSVVADDAALAPWEQLPEPLRASNRAQAADLAGKLERLGYDVVTAPPDAAHPDAAPLVFGEADIEALARDEHRRFVDERLASGWHRGPQRDPATRTSPTLVGWDELSEDERDLDRDAVRLIPALLAGAGLAVVPRRREAGQPPDAR
jgi:hypothetical protein